jgi:hypothetical protein
MQNTKGVNASRTKARCPLHARCAAKMANSRQRAQSGPIDPQIRLFTFLLKKSVADHLFSATCRIGASGKTHPMKFSVKTSPNKNYVEALRRSRSKSGAILSLVLGCFAFSFQEDRGDIMPRSLKGPISCVDLQARLSEICDGIEEHGDIWPVVASGCIQFIFGTSASCSRATGL